MVFLAILAQEEDAVDAARAEDGRKFLHQREVVDDGDPVVVGKRHDLLVLLQEGGRVIRVIGERIAGHIGEEVHACEPIELTLPRQFTPLPKWCRRPATHYSWVSR